jgi:hypothetical protein
MVDNLIQIVAGTQTYTYRFTGAQEFALAAPPSCERDDDGAGWLAAL